MEASNNKEFGKKDYWNQRFQQEKTYDWLANYSDFSLQFQQILTKYNLSKQSKILVTGCGNSELSFDLYNDGYTNLISMDYSDVVIKNMEEKYKELKWVVSDISEMKEFENESFDIVIEKGVIDVLMVNENDVWVPDESVKLKVNKTFTEIKRILKPKNSLFLSISFQQPHFRKKYLIPKDSPYSSTIDENQNYYGWQYSLMNVDKGLGYFMYILYFNEK